MEQTEGGSDVKRIIVGIWRVVTSESSFFSKGEMTMQRINAIDPQAATGTAKALLDGVQREEHP